MALDLSQLTSTLQSLSSSLSTLGQTPGVLKILGQHLSQSNELQAIGLLDAMSANPNQSAALLGALAAIPNIPPEVVGDVTQAISNINNPQVFAQSIASARTALLQAATHADVLSTIFGG